MNSAHSFSEGSDINPEQSGNSGELKPEKTAFKSALDQVIKTSYVPKEIRKEEVKSDWEKEAREYGESFKTGEWFENLRIEAFKAGCNHVYETLVKPLKEFSNGIESGLSECERKYHESLSQIASLKEENERLKAEVQHFHDLYIEKLNINQALHEEIQHLKDYIQANT